jgi:outer membrane protein TolC
MRTLRIHPLLLILLFVLLQGVSQRSAKGGEPVGIYNLDESVAQALSKNYALKARKERIEQARMVKNQARADFLPKAATSYSYTRLDDVLSFKSGLGGDIPVTTRDNYASTTSVTQPIFTGFALLSTFELAKLGIDQSETEMALETLDLALRVKEAYFNILIADKGIEVAEKDVQAREANLEVARSFHQVGLVPINDVLRAEVELANSTENLATAKNAAKLTRAAFNTLLTRSVNDQVALEDILIYREEPFDFSELTRRAMDKRPEMQLIEISLLQADQEVRLARSKYYPEVALTWEYLREGDDWRVSGDDFHQDPRWQVTAGLTWTFWEWGKTFYGVREKEGLKRELMQRKLELEDSIRLEVKDALLRLENAAENIPTTEKAVEQGEENLRVNEERYKAQVTTITDVLDAQTLLTQARVNRYRALYNHNLARFRLQRALGSY